MATVLHGDRIGREATIRIGCAGILFDEDDRVLMTQRTDNGLWCLPGGAMDPGEDASEACCRELLEETGLEVAVTRLVAVYSTPNRVTRYADGNTHQFVSLLFEVRRIGGELGLSDETTAAAFLSDDDIAELEVMDNHLERIADARGRMIATIIR